MDYFFDTYALIETIKGSATYLRFSKERLNTGKLNLAELYIHLRRNGVSPSEAKTRTEKFATLAIGAGLEDLLEAMEFRIRSKGKNLSFVDGVGYTLAKKQGLTFLTGDPAFEGVPGVEFVK